MRLFAKLLITISLVAPLTGQITDGSVFEGRVVDSNGFVVVGADVELRGPNTNSACKTGNRGIFKCTTGTTKSLEITVRANGFSILRQTIANIQENNALIEFRLEVAEVGAEVVVSTLKAKTSTSETPASIHTTNREDVITTAANSTDGVLRRGVGFGLFRRNGSRSANPTTQGVSLRGVNASGASRSSVLYDGLALNDPFGGWITWGRVPRLSIERIEVLRGGSSSHFGSGALGGTALITPREPEEPIDVAVEFSLGSMKTYEGSFFAGAAVNGWSGSFSASSFQTRGFRIVTEADRGPVDDFANSRDSVLTLRLSRDLGADSRIFGHTTFFGEARNNGTPVQKNGTYFREFSLGLDMSIGTFDRKLSNTRVVTRFWGSSQVFDQKFSAVSSDRSSEFLVRLQRVPAQRTGVSSQLSTLFRGNSIASGFELVEVRGSSNEIGFFGGRATSAIGSGGRDRRTSLYFSDFFRVDRRVNISGSLRYDRWNNSRGLSTSRRLSTNIATITVFPDRTDDAISPHGAVLLGITDEFSVYGSAGRSFRAPTLNELYRGFRVGNIITDPNAFLVAESATNLEFGGRYVSGSKSFQAAFFRTTVSDAVSNVTFDPGPPLILRRRENAGEIRSQGLETETEFLIGPARIRAGYLFTSARVVRFSANSQLEGLRIPQVPFHQFTFSSDLTPGTNWLISLHARASGSQFDDDLNNRKLESYFQADIYVSKKFGENARVFAAIENLFNNRYSTRLTPVRTTGAPFSFRAGIGWN
ncbi:MAG: TonB-dependent receptor [Pyrinomonadaceae bacterium]|nr:TonB-dependent receptor [Pyrinomonadaceae bacterium]